MRNFSKRFILPLGVILIGMHFGCQDPTLVTTVNNSPAGAVNGMLYYLPIGKLTIKGEYKSSDSSDTGSKKDAVKKLADNPAPTPTPTPVANPTPTPTPGPLTITLTAEVEADAKAGDYYVVPQSNPIYEDEVRVTVNAKRLLSAGNVTTEDKTADIIGAAASIAAQARGFAGEVQQEEPPQPFNFSFHPSNHGEYGWVQGQLKKRHIGLTVTKVSKTPVQTGPPISSMSSDEFRQLAAQFGQSGLLFRGSALYKVRLFYPLNKEYKEPAPSEDVQIAIKNTQQVILPDLDTLYVLEYRRMAFVKKVRNVGFSDGMLADFNQKVPSPILGFLGIPKAILQAIVPIPGAPPADGSASSSGTAAAAASPPKS